MLNMNFQKYQKFDFFFVVFCLTLRHNTLEKVVQKIDIISGKHSIMYLLLVGAFQKNNFSKNGTQTYHIMYVFRLVFRSKFFPFSTILIYIGVKGKTIKKKRGN